MRAAQGEVVEGVKRVKKNKPPKPPIMYKNGAKLRLPPLIDLEIAKNAVFYLKVLNKIYSGDFFEEYMN